MEQLINILKDLQNNFDPLDIDMYQYLLNIIYTNNTVFNQQYEVLNQTINETLAKIKEQFFEVYDIDELFSK